MLHLQLEDAIKKRSVRVHWAVRKLTHTFFIILFCLWKNSTLMSPHTGSGCGNSKYMYFSSRLVFAGLEVWIFTFSWYTTN